MSGDCKTCANMKNCKGARTMKVYEVTIGSIFLVEEENRDAAIERAIELYRQSFRTIGAYVREIDGATSTKDLIVTNQ